jgi:hypothetical protein
LPLAALKTSLALWRRRYNARLKLRAVARQDLLEARDADLHPRRALVDRQILREQQTQEALQTGSGCSSGRSRRGSGGVSAGRSSG